MAKLKKNNGQILEQVSLGSLDKSSFVQDYNVRGTGNLGKLIPIRAYSTLPGDQIKSNTSLAVNFQPLAVPMLDNMYLKYENFKVPYRIVWDNWEEFWTKGEDLKSVLRPPTISIQDIFSFLGSMEFNEIVPIVKEEYYEIKDNTLAPDYGSNYLAYYDFNNDEWNQEINVGAGPTLYNSFVDIREVHIIEQFRNNLIQLAERLGMLDLIDDITTALDALQDFINNINVFYEGSQARPIIPIYDYEWNSDAEQYRIKYPIFPRSRDGYGSPRSFAEFPIDWRNGGKYTDELGDFMKNVYATLYFNQIFPITNEGDYVAFAKALSMVALPNPKFLEYIQLIYDVIKPFVGVGSNWDMLGYGAVKYVDLLAVTLGNALNGVTTLMDDYTSIAYQGNMPYSLNALDLRCLYSVWYWYYRDVLLEKDAPEPRKTDEIESDELFTLLIMRHRCWEKDTFTTALADTGNGSVVVPLQDGVVTGSLTEYVQQVPLKDEQSVKLQGMDVVSYTLTDGTKLNFPSRFLLGKHDIGGNVDNDVRDTAFSLDTLDRARTLQKWLSKALVYGNRPEDALYTRWRVKYADARLQLPEFISKDSTLVRMDVLVNNTTNEISNAGDKASNMYANTQGAGFNEYFYEHGLLLTLATVMPENDYGYGRRRDVSRLDAFDYPDPDFARLGYDAVYTDELVVGPISSEFLQQNATAQPLEVFGYQRRYYDFVTKHSEIHGELLDTMDYYTFARKFSVYDRSKYPLLNYEFVHCHPRTDMFVMNDPRVSLMWFDVHHSQVVTRALPVVSQVF